MEVKVSSKSYHDYCGDMIVHLVRQEEKGVPKCEAKTVHEVMERVFKAGDFSAKEGQTLLYYPKPAPGKKKGAGRIMVVGAGKEELERELFRRLGGSIATAAMKTKAVRIMVVLPQHFTCDFSEMAECLTEGMVLGAYRFQKYKSKNHDKDEESVLELVEVVLQTSNTVAAGKGVKKGVIAGVAACAARDMANEPGNHWTPAHFAGKSLELAKKYGFACTVLDKEEMRHLGMGGIIGVNQGSEQPPHLVILEYHSSKNVPTLLLVGKGLTFDSGGISLKPGKGMEDMKYDMCGGAAVLALMQAIGEERPKKINLVALVPSTENLPGPAALKPGDIIKHYNGKTVEVVNTDAEGRLILADALAYGVKKYKPDMVIDLATLTGAVIVGLGHHRTGLLSNNDEFARKIMAAGERAGELLWQLPLDKEYTKQLKSEVADLKNVGDSAGTIVGAAFLQEFVGDTTWAHLDIAGTAWNYTEKSYVPKGPSGIGVRTLLELVRGWK